MTKKHMPDGAYIWYLIFCVVTLGGAYFLKTVIMKAIIDSQERS
jgi:hypothetical protein